MIPALVYLAVYLLCGLQCARWLLPRHRPLNRIWIGLSLGLLLEMWLPALCAFVLRFSVTGHLAALALLLLITFLVWVARDRRPARLWDADETALLRQMLFTVLPLTVLSAYLQYTHTLRPDAYGSLNVGQSTYGDLPMHLSFITNLKDKMFPADYPFYPGMRLSYPFLTDSLSTTFYLFGCSLQSSVIIPGTLMMALCFTGVIVLGREMTAGKKTVVLTAMLFFLNGGLGFLYDFDMAGGFEADGTPTVLERISAIMTGYYKTPTNQPDPNNLRWSNVIADLMIPQRTLLGGWCMVMPCFYLLETSFNAEKRDPGDGHRALLLLGMWGGALPLIHTHSFLALALSSLGTMMYDLVHGDPKSGISPDGTLRVRRSRGAILAEYFMYGALAAAVAVPQLFGFTFAQTFRTEGSTGFLAFHFNWVNNPGDSGMRDMYFWFYLKNIGLPFALLLLALIEKDRRHRRLFALALPVILAAELIRFQPNEYDNNKLLYLAYLPCCMIIADYCRDIMHRLKGLRARPVIAAAAAVVFFLSAGLTLCRECVSSYQAFGSGSVEAGTFARDETPAEAVYLTGTQHLDPVLSLAGKTIVCGPDLWLYFHGFDTTERKNDIRRFYEDPDNNLDVLTRYDVDYIYVSSYEMSDYDVDTDALDRMFTPVFENDEAVIYRVTGKGLE
ncbi:MAG: hypothetical protein Q4G19_02700 [Clostridia bacterium]|nr:hypothetical protein [Clostridia bacterium]